MHQRTSRQRHSRLLSLIVILTLLLGTLSPQPVRAATITLTIDTTTDSNTAAYQNCTAAAVDCSLRGAISKANADSANSYIINVPAGTYVLSLSSTNEDSNTDGDLDISDNLTIHGAGAVSTIIDANRIDRVFDIRAGATVEINDLTIKGGQAPAGKEGGGIRNTSDLTLNNCAVTDNLAGDGSDGADSTFDDNRSPKFIAPDPGQVGGSGGGVYNLGGATLTLNASTVSTNQAGDDWQALGDTFAEDGYLCARLDRLSLFTLTVPGAPATGFPVGVVTDLQGQPAIKAYSTVDDFRLEIPALGVELPIVGVPLTIDGWDVIWLEDEVCYLYGTAFPTWAGNTALTAHVWNADNTPGPFVDLHTLQHGDEIVIHAWGERYVYEVRATREVRADNLSFMEPSDFDILTLITCKDFDQASGKYDWRLTITAVLVDIH